MLVLMCSRDLKQGETDVSRQIFWGITWEEQVSYVCIIVYLCWDVCACVCPWACVHASRSACMCACSHYGFLSFLNLCICCVCKWKMEVCWPVLTMKKKNVCSQLPICKCFGRVKMLSTQPWRLDSGHTDRLSQPAVSEPSRKDLSICFQPGRLCFSGQNLGLQMILANNLS